MAKRRSISAVLVPRRRADDALLPDAVGTVAAALPAACEEFEIVVLADDASADLTEAVKACDFARIIKGPADRAYGDRVRAGIDAARHPLIVLVAADSPCDLSAVAEVAAPADSVDLVVACRSRRDEGLCRRAVASLVRKKLAVVYGVRVDEWNCGLVAFRRKVLKHMTLTSRGLFIEAEILAKANALGYRIAEAEVAPSPRAAASGGLTLSQAMSMIADGTHMLGRVDMTLDESVGDRSTRAMEEIEDE